MKGRYVASHTLLRNFILFIIVPFFCAPFGITLLWAILVGSTGQGKPSTALILIYAFVLLLSVPGSIILMLNNYRRKADQTRCLVTENSIDCVTASGRKLTIATKAIMKIEAKESRLQKKYGLGDIWLVCTPGDMAHTIILNDIDDFTNSYTMLKSALGTK